MASHLPKKNVRGRTTNWWCSIRGKPMRCPASVSQRQNQFIPGIHKHCHRADPGVLIKAKLSVKVKEKAKVNMFQPAMGIVEEAIQVETTEDDFCLPNPHLLKRRANRAREKLRPSDPADLEFDLDVSYIPEDFFRKDVRVDDARHLIFATETQLVLLQKAKRWYLDATFKVVREPFAQLFSIHAFLKSGDETKQVPLVYALMSRRRGKDYRKVLKNIGLATEYTKKETTHKFVRKLLALPFLPAEHIEPTFEHMKGKSSQQLHPLVEYIEATWITSTTWPPENWSVYGQSVRTNNDVEGRHRCLNYRSNGIPPFYLLIDRLFNEAKYLKVQYKLISERKLKKNQRKKHQNTTRKLFELWDEYNRGEIGPMKLLRACANIYTPTD